MSRFRPIGGETESLLVAGRVQALSPTSMDSTNMNRLIGVMMLLFVIGAEIVGFAQWISPADREYADNPVAVQQSATR